MAINKKLIHFNKLQKFQEELAKGNILPTSIVFIRDSKLIWTHGQFYHCPYTKEEIETLLENKIDKVEGKQLSTEDFTTELKTKLDGLNNITKVSQLTNDSGYQTESQVNAAIQQVVGAAPEVLDTLEEIADKLSNNDDVVASIVSTLANKADQSLIGDINTEISNINDEINDITTGITNLETDVNKLKSDLEFKVLNIEYPLDMSLNHQIINHSYITELVSFLNNILIFDKSILSTTEDRNITINSNHVIKIKNDSVECHLKVNAVKFLSYNMYLLSLIGTISLKAGSQSYIFSLDCVGSMLISVSLNSLSAAGVSSVNPFSLNINHNSSNINLFNEMKFSSPSLDTMYWYNTLRNNVKIEPNKILIRGLSLISSYLINYPNQDDFCKDYRKSTIIEEVSEVPNSLTIPQWCNLTEELVKCYHVQLYCLGLDNNHYYVYGYILADNNNMYVDSDLTAVLQNSMPKIFFALSKDSIDSSLNRLTLYTDYPKFQIGIAYSATNSTPTKENNSKILGANTFSDIYIYHELNNLLPEISTKPSLDTFKYYLRFYLDTNFAAVDASNRVYDTVTYVVYASTNGHYLLTTIDDWNADNNDNK